MVYFTSFLLIVTMLYNEANVANGALKIFDLTYDFDNDTIYWPTARQWSFKLMDAGSNAAFEYEGYRFSAAEHGGTHIDSPRHFSRGKLSTHDIPVEKLVGKAFIVDMSNEVKNNRDFLITKEYLQAAEKNYKTTMDNKIVLLYTGFTHYYPNVNDYLGTDTTNASLLHFPGLDPDAAQWIVQNRNIKSIGIDVASIDYGQSTTYNSHRHLARVNIPIFENLNLKDIGKFQSKDDVMIYALPMKIKGGSGGPLRIIATYDDSVKSGGLCNRCNLYAMLIVVMLSMVLVNKS